jgi:hypothetical protein
MAVSIIRIDVGNEHKLLSCDVFNVRVNVIPATYEE